MKYILVLLCAGLLTSCLEGPDMSNDDGAQAEAIQVGTAIVNAWGPDNPAGIGYNEKVSIDYTQEFLGYPSRVSMQESFTAIAKDATSDPKTIIFAMAHRLNEIDSDGNDHISTTTKYLGVAKSLDDDDSPEVASQSLKTASLVQTMAANDTAYIGTFKILMLLGSCELSEEDRKACAQEGLECSQRCYNLNVSTEQVAPPAPVQARPNCGGVPNCMMDLKKVSFDIIIETKKGSTTQKQKVTRWVSIFQGAPYMSKLMENCYRGLVKLPNSSQRVLATLCDRVVDFKYGSGSFPTGAPVDSSVTQ